MRHVLYIPVWFLLGASVALIWVEQVLDDTFDLWKLGLNLPQIERERQLIYDAQTWLSLAIPFLIIGTIIVDRILRKRDGETSEDQSG